MGLICILIWSFSALLQRTENIAKDITDMSMQMSFILLVLDIKVPFQAVM